MASLPTQGSHPYANAPTNKVAGYFFNHNNAARVNTDAYLYDIICSRHPGLTVTVVPEYTANLQAYAASNPTIASTHPVHPDDENSSTQPPSDTPSHPIPPVSPRPPHKWPSSLKWTLYAPPPNRITSRPGQLITQTFYASFLFTWKSQQFLVYFIDGRDGTSAYPEIRNQYIVASSKDPVHAMLRVVGEWSATLHEEIWVFNEGYWQKDASLYAAILKSCWEDVILPDALKQQVMGVADKFFDDKTRETYHRLRVPWKRGIIFYGPPGNGKTVSIKATMHALYSRDSPIPTLYVKTLASFMGPEYSINLIFEKARSYAPCYLVFEDLDSLVTPQVRSFFLNAVDGVSDNEGILMVGSTNHLEKLDEGISKRPSRFDRKYEFGLPDEGMRRRYAEFWQGKLKGDKGGDSVVDGVEVQKEKKDETIEFPDVLVGKIAQITDGFSFAYMQEAFVSALLIIAGREEGVDHISSRSSSRERAGLEVERQLEEARDDFEVINLGSEGKDGDGEKDPLDKYVLWKEIKVQVALLKKEIRKEEAA